jgi:Ser/Thr protein kinase RdoA (MazF antagonist)
MEDIPQRIRDQIVRMLGPVEELTSIHKGLSNASVYKIQTSRGTYALKQFSNADFAWEKLHRIHHFQKTIVNGGFEQAPRILDWPNSHSLFEDEDCWWELSTWKPGESISTIGASSTAQLRNAMQILAKLHALSKPICSMSQQSPGLEFRLHSLMQPVLNLEDRRVQEIRRDPQLEQLIVAIDRHSRFRLHDLKTGILQLARHEWHCQWIVRDIWRAHVLFEGDQVTGVIDFAAAAVDTPLLDLTRLLGTLMPPTDPRWSEMVQLYCQESRQDFELETTRLLDEVSTFLSGRNWLMWLVAGNIQLKNAGIGSRERWSEIQRKLTDYMAES